MAAVYVINPVPFMFADVTWAKLKSQSALSAILGRSRHIDVCSRSNFSAKFGFNFLLDAIKTG